MADSYRVLVIEDDTDPLTYLRLVLLRTHSARLVRCPPSVRALLRAVNSAGSYDSACGATSRPLRPVTLILNADPARLDVLTAYFGDAGCAVIAVTDIEQALSMCSVVSPDLMVLAQTQSGIRDAELDRLRSRHRNSRVVVTTVLGPEAAPCPATQSIETRWLAVTAK